MVRVEIRRRESPGPARLPVHLACLRQYDDVADNTAKNPDAGGVKPAQGISHFLAKVLDQLSLSAWLPAVVLVASIAVMVELHAKKSLNIAPAIQVISETKPVGLLVILLFGVVVAAVLTQSFAFELIRLWEGYWGATALVLPLLRLRVRRHRKRAEKARRRLEERKAAALGSALEALRSFAVLTETQIRVVKWLAEGADRSEKPASGFADRRMARRIQWREHASPALMDSEDRWRARLENYPSASRILPTRLGNALRAREDRITDAGRSLEGLVMRRYQTIPPRLLTRHDQFRDRLEMYCVLITVFIFLAVAAVPLLAPCGGYLLASAGGFVLFGAFAVISYAAAVSSAGGYGAVLAQIAQLPVDAVASQDRERRSPIAKTIAWLSRAPW